MRELLHYVACVLVDHPEDVRVDEETSDQGVTLKLHVRRDDIGKVIGKQGRTARSIRTLLGAAGMKLNRRFTLEILE